MIMAFKAALSHVKTLLTPPTKKPARTQPKRHAQKKPDDDYVYPSGSRNCSIILGSTLSESQLMTSPTHKTVVPETQPIAHGNDSIVFFSQSPDAIPNSQPTPNSQTTPTSRHGSEMRSALSRTFHDEHSP
jgi:hypothetical protein